MKNATVWTVVLCAGAWCLLAGCGGVSTPTGDLDNLTDDTNNNGYFDVDPPDGVEFLTLDNVNIGLVNLIDQSDVGSIAAAYGIDPSLLNLVTIVASFDVTLDYGAGITDTLSESEEVKPFEKKFEIACPDSVSVHASVVANVPFVGPQLITEFDVDLTEGVEYECGQTIEVEIYMDEAGNPATNLDVS